MIPIILGLVAGFIWFIFFERIDQKKMDIVYEKKKCWEVLHYFHKKIPLFIVHSKSILGGLLLIILGYSNYKYKNQIIIFIGSVIIGLHIIQMINEFRYIKNYRNQP